MVLIQASEDTRMKAAKQMSAKACGGAKGKSKPLAVKKPPAKAVYPCDVERLPKR